MPHVPRRLRTVIRKALEINPADRYSAASDMLDALGKVEISLDWSLTRSANGELRWRAEREGRPDLLVKLSPSSFGRWGVSVFTSRGSCTRAKSPDQYARGQLTRKQADVHLKKVFEELTV